MEQCFHFLSSLSYQKTNTVIYPNNTREVYDGETQNWYIFPVTTPNTTKCRAVSVFLGESVLILTTEIRSKNISLLQYEYHQVLISPHKEVFPTVSDTTLLLFFNTNPAVNLLCLGKLWIHMVAWGWDLFCSPFPSHEFPIFYLTLGLLVLLMVAAR